MPSRYYFYDKAGRELKDHPLNACSNVGGGAALTVNHTMADEDNDSRIWKDGKGRIARSVIYRRDWEARKTFPVTIADFPGHRHILVKAWYPKDTIPTEYFWLVPAPAPAAVYA